MMMSTEFWLGVVVGAIILWLVQRFLLAPKAS